MADFEESRPRALVVSKKGRFWVGDHLFERGNPQVPLARGRVKVGPGGIALCRMDRRGGQPIVDLGSADVPRDVVGALVADRGLRPTFRDRHEQEARDAVNRLARDPGARRDLVAEPTFTVDPKTARDFDDAVSARREGDGMRLWIHIADVAAHVKPDGGLDQEARTRANSTYAPGMVSPMLPETLSSDACSLRPGVERLAVTSEILLKPNGEVASASFYRSLIRSDVRLDYEALDEIFASRERAPEPVADAIEVAREAAALLGSSRSAPALEVTSSEPEFTFAEDGSVSSAHTVPETEAHRLIERLMVLTNEQVARLVEREGVPALYRVHEQPNPARVEFMLEQLESLGIPTPAMPKDAESHVAGSIAVEASSLAAAEAKRRGYGAASWSSLVLRSLQPARYADENLGHAGLGSLAYAHFTSPIRRYPDLIVHRALLSVVEGSEDRPSPHEVADAALHCSSTERDSMKVERTADDICAAFLLQRELFERGQDQKFEGEVTGVIRSGVFIRFAGEKADVYEGFYPARRMPGDRFEINDVETALAGLRTGRAISMGDPVEVKVDSVAAARGRVDLVGAEDKKQPGSGRGGRGGRRRRPEGSRR